MELIYDRCAGLDVHKRSVTACVRMPAEDNPATRTELIRTFTTFTADLEAMLGWLVGLGVTVVAMEATGVFWWPVWRVLEGHGLRLVLANARHVKNVPGRKTDVKDAAWLAQLCEHGLVAASFVPPPAVRRLRAATRYRKRLVQAHSQEWQRIAKTLEEAGIKLDSVASKLQTVSARHMLDALVAGERDPDVLADMALKRMRDKLDQLRLALAGGFDEHHARLVGLMLKRTDDLGNAIKELDERIEQLCEPWTAVLARLETIPGVARHTAQVIVAETGGDMSIFPTAAHLASWAGLCPGNNRSAGKRRPERTGQGNKWLREALRQAASAAAKSKNTYLASQYWQLARRRGNGKADVAVAHTLLVIAWHLMALDVDYSELGADWFERRNRGPARINRLVQNLNALGYRVTLDPLKPTAD